MSVVKNNVAKWHLRKGAACRRWLRYEKNYDTRQELQAQHGRHMRLFCDLQSNKAPQKGSSCAV